VYYRGNSTRNQQASLALFSNEKNNTKFRSNIGSLLQISGVFPVKCSIALVRGMTNTQADTQTDGRMKSDRMLKKRAKKNERRGWVVDCQRRRQRRVDSYIGC